MTRTDTLELGQLAEYDVVGELAGRDDARQLLANRRSDQRAVLITVVREPAGDQRNALGHLAADTNLLASNGHPHVVPVIEGRWLGTDAFAIVTERPAWPALEELLSRRDEDFSFARIAAILRDVNAALEWARAQKVVHRTLGIETVFVEPGSDDVKVTFRIAVLPATGIPGADADARTIASLARAMLTRSAMDPERDRLPLAELRPGLPSGVIEQTDALLSTDGDAMSDASGYISAIAMAEDLKRAEDERENIRREIDDEQRRIRAELAAEREAHDRDLADQAKRFAEERERERASMAKEQERAQQALAREREKAEKEIAKARAALEKGRQHLARERQKFEQEMARARDQVAARLAAIGEQESLYAATSELPVAPADASVGRQEEHAPMDATPLVEHAADAPPEPYDELVEDDWSKENDALVPAPALRGWSDRLGRSPAVRTAGIALLVLVILVAASAVGLSRRGHRRVASVPALAVQVDSTGGNVVAPVTAADTTPLGAAIESPAATQPAVAGPIPSSPRPRAVRATPAAAPAAARDSAPNGGSRDSSPAPEPGQRRSSQVVTPPRADSVTPLPFTGTDSARRDSTLRTARDSMSKMLPKIVLPKPDSITTRRDTTSRP